MRKGEKMLLDNVNTSSARRTLESISAPLPLPQDISVQTALTEILEIDIVPLRRVSLQDKDKSFFRGTNYHETLEARIDRLYAHRIEMHNHFGIQKVRMQLCCDKLTPLDLFVADPMRLMKSSINTLQVYALCFKELDMRLLASRFSRLLSAMLQYSCVVIGDYRGNGDWRAFEG